MERILDGTYQGKDNNSYRVDGDRYYVYDTEAIEVGEYLGEDGIPVVEMKAGWVEIRPTEFLLNCLTVLH